MITKSGQFSIGDTVVWRFGGEDEIVRFGRNGTHAFLSKEPGVGVPVDELKLAGQAERSETNPLPLEGDSSPAIHAESDGQSQPSTSESEAN